MGVEARGTKVSRAKINMIRFFCDYYVLLVGNFERTNLSRESFLAAYD